MRKENELPSSIEAEKAVTLSEDKSVESALYWTEKLYIRGESTKYHLNTEYSSTRNPVSENGGKFIFDQIDYCLLYTSDAADE